MENGEPVHVHVRRGKPSSGSTKIWLTGTGGCIVANNDSALNRRELADVCEFICANHGAICEAWSSFFHGDLAFYK
ncbi:MAG: DUF4160 domain-containing protein [Coriobacteriia bacterium]|nr:DUF4160 domain-containing protein [Coriobacteriia bacterium]